MFSEGSMGSVGSASWRGVPRFYNHVGAALHPSGEGWQVTCEPGLTFVVRQALEDAGIAVESSDLTMVPTTTVELDTVEAAASVLRIIDALEDHDDVGDVFANMDLPDDVLAQLED
jgi:transcriptional/translational regulatory protein YebC/TACO1